MDWLHCLVPIVTTHIILKHSRIWYEKEITIFFLLLIIFKNTLMDARKSQENKQANIGNHHISKDKMEHFPKN